jgi:hypothetical protein
VSAAVAPVEVDPLAPPRSARAWFAVTAVVAWAGVVLQTILTVWDVYPDLDPEPGRFGYLPGEGFAAVLGRTIDLFSYFTIVSNLLVAIVVTALAVDLRRGSRGWRVLRLASLVMIIVTGVVYAVLLAPDATNVGWQVPANQLVHIWTPILAVLGWLVLGPRGWVDLRTVLLSLLIPLGWLAYTLVRGAVIDAYPYDFLNVYELGYATALGNVGGVLVFGLVVAAALWGIDVALTRWQLRRRA